MKVPRPKPALDLNFLNFEVIYGSPIYLIRSEGKPGPASSIII